MCVGLGGWGTGGEIGKDVNLSVICSLRVRLLCLCTYLIAQSERQLKIYYHGFLLPGCIKINHYFLLNDNRMVVAVCCGCAF